MEKGICPFEIKSILWLMIPVDGCTRDGGGGGRNLSKWSSHVAESESNQLWSILCDWCRILAGVLLKHTEQGDPSPKSRDSLKLSFSTRRAAQAAGTHGWRTQWLRPPRSPDLIPDLGHPRGSWCDWDPHAPAGPQPALALSCTTSGARPAQCPWTGLKSAGPPPTCAPWDKHTYLTAWQGDISFMGLPWWHSGKESTCQSGHRSSISRSGRSPGVGNASLLQYSCRENPVDRGAWRATVQRVTKSWTRLSNWAHAHNPFYEWPNWRGISLEIYRDKDLHIGMVRNIVKSCQGDGNSLVVQWLGLVSTFTSMAQVRSLLRGTEIPQAMWDGLITKKVIKLTIKVQTTKEKNRSNGLLDIKIWNCLSKDIVNRVKGNPENGRKYLQIMYMIN